MGWGTFFNAEMYIDRESYNTIGQLDSAIEDCRREIQNIRERLLMYCASGPYGVSAKDCEDNPMNPVDAIHIEVTNLLEWYDSEQLKLTKLEYLREDWDEAEQKFKTMEVG